MLFKNKKVIDMNYYNTAKFILVISIAGILLGFLNNTHPNMHFEEKLVAEHTSYLLNLVGINAQVNAVSSDVIIKTGWLETKIIPACVGWFGLFAVSALIIAYPASIKKKATGLIISLPIMYTVNILRLTTTISIGYYKGLRALAFVHDFLWKTVLVTSAFALWLLWIWFIVEKKTMKDMA